MDFSTKTFMIHFKHYKWFTKNISIVKIFFSSTLKIFFFIVFNFWDRNQDLNGWETCIVNSNTMYIYIDIYIFHSWYKLTLNLLQCTYLDPFQEWVFPTPYCFWKISSQFFKILNAGITQVVKQKNQTRPTAKFIFKFVKRRPIRSLSSKLSCIVPFGKACLKWI